MDFRLRGNDKMGIAGHQVSERTSMNERFAQLPEPPYYAVIFSSRRNGDDDAGYAAASQRMLELAEQQPGFLGVEATRDAEGFGVTVSYWRDEASIAAWKYNAEHAQTRAHGRAHWYAHYELRVARVERAYGKPAFKKQG